MGKKQSIGSAISDIEVGYDYLVAGIGFVFQLLSFYLGFLPPLDGPHMRHSSNLKYFGDLRNACDRIEWNLGV